MYENKIYKSLAALTDQVRLWKGSGSTIVFTNGVFDLIHKGHITYLEQAAALGDKVVVAINSDESVKRLKGNTRPINNEWSRAAVLAGLGAVDAVVLFSEDTPLRVIQSVLPHTLVKGGDYSLDEIVGAAEVIAHGGDVSCLTFLKGYSSTDIINKIKRL